MKARIAVGYAALIAAVAVVAALLLAQQSSGGLTPTLGKQFLAFQLTDPPQVPNGTQALLVSYTSARVHETTPNGTSAWVSANVSGTLNLMFLVNVTQTIARLQVSNNATINQAQFDITSANITVNGTTYPVILASHTITANVTSHTTVSDNSSVLVDFTPTIVTIYTSNSTVFVMVPSVKAVLIGSVKQVSLRVGARGGLGAQEDEELGRITPNITITSASLATSDNNTYLSVTVKDNSNQSVDLRHVLLFGLPNVFVNVNDTANVVPDRAMARVGSDLGAHASIPLLVSANSSDSANVRLDMRGEGMHSGMVSAIVNGRIVSGDNISAALGGEAAIKAEPSIGEAFLIARFRTLNFVILSNGTLALPFFSQGEFGDHCTSPRIEANAGAGIGAGQGGQIATSENAVVMPMYCLPFDNNTGYVLKSGDSVTLTFSGRIGFGGVCSHPEVENGSIVMPPCPLGTSIVANETYRIVVSGEKGARAETAVVAKRQ